MPILTLQTNSNNDLILPDGKNIAIISGVDALVQAVRQAGLMRLGEDIFDTTTGVDYLGTVFNSPPNLDAARVSLSAAITKFDDVISVQSLIMTLEGDKLVWVADILTIYGSLQVSS